MKRLALISLLAGCSSVFGLEAPRRGDAGASDGIVEIDAMPDARSCALAALNDEDGDSIDDACDGCPTIAGDAADDDNDGLPNVCDPNISPGGDHIAGAWMFTNAAELDDFDTSSATLSTGSQGIVTVTGGGSLRTMTSFMPTLVEVRLLGFSGTTTANIEVRTKDASCMVRATKCNGTNASVSCIVLGQVSAELSAPSTEISMIRLRATGMGSRCEVFGASTASTMVQSMTQLGNGQVEVKTNLDATAVVQSLVIYGAN